MDDFDKATAIEWQKTAAIVSRLSRESEDNSTKKEFAKMARQRYKMVMFLMGIDGKVDQLYS